MMKTSHALVILISVCSGSIFADDRPGSANAEDPFAGLTTRILDDWREAVKTIKSNDLEQFRSHIMHPERSTAFFPGLRESIALFPDVSESVAVIWYTRPSVDPDSRSIRDCAVISGPFSLTKPAKVTYSVGEWSADFPLEDSKPYYLYVQLTNEKEDSEEKVENPAEYRFQTPILPLSLEQCVEQISPRKKQLTLKDEDHNLQAFSKDGEKIKEKLLDIWAKSD